MKFEKVSFDQFFEDLARCINLNTFDNPVEYARTIYDNIKLPIRGTISSAGYDFFLPYDVEFHHNEDVLIPTGIRFQCDPDKFLLCVPRSGSGFSYGLSLLNTCGVIDCDYYHSDNEGHIMMKLSCKYDFNLSAGRGIMQGIILPYFKVENEKEIKTKRNGGFGSTNR